MLSGTKGTFLLVGSFADSILAFRGDLLKSISTRNCQVHVAAPGLNIDSDVGRKLVDLGFYIHSIPLKRTGMNPIRDIYFFFFLYFLMLRVKPSHVLSYTVKPVIYGTIAAWLARVKYRYAMITGLGFAFSESSWMLGGFLKKGVRVFYMISLRYASGIIFQNKDDLNFFLEKKIVARSVGLKVVNGSGVDISYYQFRPSNHSDISFLFIARLLVDKGVREYVHAAEIIKRKFPSAKFRVAGWLDDNPNCISESELSNWIAAGVIEYLGRLEDVRPAIDQASVFVLPSYREGTPRTVLEAMSMGKAIITSDAPGCRQTVVEGVNGFLVPVKDVAALSSAMLKFFNEPSLARVMGNNSRLLAENLFDVRKVNKEMIEFMKI